MMVDVCSAVNNREKIIPFLRWAGGKRWLIASQREIFPKKVNRYIEPFLGSAAVFFGVNSQSSILSDTNPHLIETYIEIRDNWIAVKALLDMHARSHSRIYYYGVRDLQPKSSAEKAARFIYLNRTCFNGIYRVNKQGKFNVPKGTRDNVLLNSDDFLKISCQLQSADLKISDFEPIIDSAATGDFVFIDPPYTVAHNSNGFVKYNENLFSWEDQIRLRDCLHRASSRSVNFVMTNADHPSVAELYRNGFSILKVPRSSSIAGSSKSRNPITELIIRPIQR